MTKFQVGDMVIAPRLFKGELPISKIVANSNFPIWVKIDAGSQWCFTEDGKHGLLDLEPSLFHAGTKITIEEAEPIRWPWVNVYRNEHGDTWSGFETYNTYHRAYKEGQNSKDYLFTIQLKPPEEKS